jgi:AraC family transcriptional regulator
MSNSLIARRFRLPAAPTVQSTSPASSPVTISRLRCDEPEHGTLRAMTSEDAYALHLVLRPVDVEFRLGGCAVPNEGVAAGGLYLLDLQSSTMVNFHSAFDIVRFHISAKTLDLFAREGGLEPPPGLSRPPLGHPDPALHHLATAMLPALERPDEANELFVDHVARAFHAHIARVYGGSSRELSRTRQTLTSVQARLATDMIADRLDGKVSVQELASECNLSVSHFSRGFVQTFGMPPHRWLLVRRVEYAKELIQTGGIPLAAIATTCGFATQSHFTRVFSAIVGASPSRWGRMATRKTSFMRACEPE